MSDEEIKWTDRSLLLYLDWEHQLRSPWQWPVDSGTFEKKKSDAELSTNSLFFKVDAMMWTNNSVISECLQVRFNITFPGKHKLPIVNKSAYRWSKEKVRKKTWLIAFVIKFITSGAVVESYQQKWNESGKYAGAWLRFLSKLAFILGCECVHFGFTLAAVRFIILSRDKIGPGIFFSNRGNIVSSLNGYPSELARPSRTIDLLSTAT